MKKLIKGLAYRTLIPGLPEIVRVTKIEPRPQRLNTLMVACPPTVKGGCFALTEFGYTRFAGYDVRLVDSDYPVDVKCSTEVGDKFGSVSVLEVREDGYKVERNGEIANTDKAGFITYFGNKIRLFTPVEYANGLQLREDD